MLKAKDIVNRDFVTVSSNADVRKISALLIKNRMSGLPVVEKGAKLVGFVSERDIIAAVATSKNVLKKKARDIMTKKVVSVKENALVEQVTKIFTEKPFRYIPVTRNDALVGIISRKQVINRLLGHYY